MTIEFKLKDRNGFVNDMSSPVHRALHYVKCYALHFPDSGARDVAEELLSLLESGLTPLQADAAISTHGDGQEQTAAPLKSNGCFSPIIRI